MSRLTGRVRGAMARHLTCQLCGDYDYVESTTLTDTIGAGPRAPQLHITRYPDASIAISLSGGRNLPGLMLSSARAPSISIFRLDQHVGKSRCSGEWHGQATALSFGYAVHRITERAWIPRLTTRDYRRWPRSVRVGAYVPRNTAAAPVKPRSCRRRADRRHVSHPHILGIFWW